MCGEWCNVNDVWGMMWYKWWMVCVFGICYDGVSGNEERFMYCSNWVEI